MHRFIPYSFVVACLFAVMPAYARDVGEWTGVWDTIWTDGGGRITLQQDGDSVTGEFPLYKSRVEGKVRGDRLEGRRIEGERSYAFVIVLGHDARSFAGRDDAQGWWTGVRVNSAEAPVAIKLATPRDALVNFVFSASQARCGLEDYWARAADSVEFHPETAALPRAAQLRHLQEFFDLVDLTTFRMWEIATDAPSDDLTIELRQMGSDVVLPLRLHRNGAGEWRVVVPNEAELVALRKSLLAMYGASPPTEQSFKRLHSPRDAMRAFLEGMADWNGRGRTLALSTLDLHEIPEALREADGDLAAGYLCRALHQIGFIGLQSIPNDPGNRDPFVLFEHAEGSIVIAPSGPEPDAPWQFTDGTIRSIAMVYFGTSSLAPAMEAPPGIIPSSPYFRLRDFVVEGMPALRARVARFELWQVLALLLTVPSAIFAARFLARTLSGLLERATRSMVPLPRWFAIALTVLIAVALLLVTPGLLGIPQRARAYSAPLAGAALSISISAVAWHGVTIVCLLLTRAARRSRSTVDDLAVNLLLGSLRAGIIIGCWIAIACGFSIPASNVLAGIGIGGLGVAFASRETIAHFFGAGVLVADRPFRAGDWIQSSLASGVVESIGIRSTRVRTADESVVVVPNASLASATILNLGKQRPRTFSLQILVMQGATLEKVERFIATLRDRIGANPAFMTGRTTIGISGIATNGIQIQCEACLAVDSDQAESAARHDFLVEVMAVADTEGLGLGPQLANEATALAAASPKL
jgi:small-conductance mechanosensitive channel